MEKIYLIVATTFIIATILLSVKNHLISQQYDYLISDYEALEERLIEKQERLRNYTLVSIELNNICDKYTSTRKYKAQNKKLQELFDKLN